MCLFIYIGFQLNVLLKLELLLANQQEQLMLLRDIAAATQRDAVSVDEDVLPQPLNNAEDLEQLNQKLLVPEFKNRMVMKLLVS